VICREKAFCSELWLLGAQAAIMSVLQLTWKITSRQVFAFADDKNWLTMSIAFI
jgi:hypothetical protein